eukprot:1444698-Prymnesium_polylepis.1
MIARPHETASPCRSLRELVGATARDKSTLVSRLSGRVSTVSARPAECTRNSGRSAAGQLGAPQA